MKQSFWTGREFTIKDENDLPAFKVVGQFFSWGHKLRMYDAREREVAYIEQKLLTLKPRFEIYREGRRFAEVVKEWSWFDKSFTLDVPGPNDYAIEGSFWSHEYTFTRKGRRVAEVSKRFWSWSDTYGIDVAPGEDDVAILATCVVIDLVCHEGDGD
ncbi:MAG: LURP-one-related family protein [Planctomycetota bacterium]